MKRHKTWFSLGLIALSALALALILTILPAGAVHNDDDVVGTVTTDPMVASPSNDVSAEARTIRITVEDPNLHSIQFVGTGANGETSDMMGANGQQLTAPAAYTFVLDLTRAIADRDHDGDVDSADIQIVQPSPVSVSRVLSQESGIVEFTSTSAAGGAFNVRYATSMRETTLMPADGDDPAMDLVTVQGDGDEIPLRLMETSSSSGMFTAKIMVVNGDDPATVDVPGDNLNPAGTTRPMLAVSAGSSIIVRYSDQAPPRTVTARIDVEDDSPNFSNLMPANMAVTNNLDTVLTAEVSDNIAGVDTDEPGSIRVIYTIDGGNEITAGAADVSVEETSNGSGVYVISFNINKIPTIAAEKKDETGTLDSVITWRIEASDKAGNPGRTDADATMADAQDGTLMVKTTRPVLENAYTGDNWNAGEERIDGSRRDLPGTDKRTSIRLVFDRAMMASSLDNSDFEVDGEMPNGVALGSGDDANSVFLTVDELAPDAGPKIQIVGEVLDAGGNSVDTTKDADSMVASAVDGIAPKLTITVEDDYTTGSIMLMVMSDEPIRGSQPQLTFTSCETMDADGACTEASNPGVSPRVVESRKEWTFSASGLGEAQYVVTGTVQDSAGNMGMAGSTMPKADGAVKFEIDKTLDPAATTSPAAGAKASNTEPFFIEIKWTDEGSEYSGDSHKTVTLTKAVLNAGTDNERDVMGDASSSNNIDFTIPITEIGVGMHTLTYNGMDEGGNDLDNDAVLKFEVVTPPALMLSLTVGNNLVSLPRDPADTSVQAVFGETPEVSLIFTQPRPGESDLPWMFAVRDPATGQFTGDLKNIDAKHAYVVKSSGSTTVAIDIPQLDAQQVPPSISIPAGKWMLVPVVSLAAIGDGDDEVMAGTAFCAGSYFGANLSNAYTFSAGQWKSVMADDMVMIGSGYWVLLSQDGIITPAIVRACPSSS